MNASLLIHLIRTVSWSYWRSHSVRTVLTMIGVGMGVATVVSIANISVSVLDSFRKMIDALAGPAHFEVTNWGAGVDASLLDEIRSTPGVQEANGVVEAFVPLADHPEEQVFLFGTNFLESNAWEALFPPDAVHIEDSLLFLSQPDSVAAPRALLERVGLKTGDPLVLLTASGPAEVRIRGEIDARGSAQLFGGAVLVMDLPAAQRLLGKGNKLDRIAVIVEDGMRADEVGERLTSVVAGRAQVGHAQGRGERAELLLFSLRATLLIMSLGAVIVGSFIVYQTVGISVQQRHRILAILSAAGVRRRALLHLCVVETFLVAAAGALVGLLAGQVLSRVAAGPVGGVASQIWLRVDTTEHVSSISGVLVALSVGIMAAIVAAYLSARATLASPTVEALRPSAMTPDPAGLDARRVLIATALLSAVWLVALAPPDLGLAEIVSLVIVTHSLGYAAVALIAPSLVQGAGRLARRAVQRSTGFASRLAAENLSRDARRSGATVIVIASAFGIATVVAVLAQSFENSWMTWIRQRFAADLYVGHGERVQLIAGPPMTRDLGERIGAVEGVAAVEPIRTLELTFRGRPIFLQGFSVEHGLRSGGVEMVEGSLEASAPALLGGSGVLVSSNLAYRLGLRRGDTVELPTLQGPRTFTIEGTYVDYLASLDLGSVGMDIRHLQTYWQDDLANMFRVWVEPSASVAAVRSAILKGFGHAEGLYVLNAGDFLEGVREVIQTFFAAVWALQVVAALVGIIGVVNAQGAAVIDRNRETTVLRAIGVRGSAIRRMIVIECGEIGLLGGLAGALLGLMLGAQIVLVSLRLVTGWQLTLTFPGMELLIGLALVALISAAAGYVPARIATRRSAPAVVAD
jgi:putative ABC transport system permease protein